MAELCRDELRELAEGINQAHALVESHLQGAVQHAIRAGGLLAEAKEKVPHGEWLPWLAENCAIKERTAQTYMRLSRELPKLDPAKAQRVADLPLREAVRALTSPGWDSVVASFLDVCRDILDEMESPADMSPAEVGEWIGFLPRMIRDLGTLSVDCGERRLRAEREYGKLLKERTAAREASA